MNWKVAPVWYCTLLNKTIPLHCCPVSMETLSAARRTRQLGQARQQSELRERKPFYLTIRLLVYLGLKGSWKPSDFPYDDHVFMHRGEEREKEEKEERFSVRSLPLCLEPLLLCVQTRAAPLYALYGRDDITRYCSSVGFTQHSHFIVHWWHVWNVMANSLWSGGPLGP